MRMTPDQTITVCIAVVTALPTIVFTGAVAYWTWRRDQERIVVQKSPLHWETLDGTENDATLSGVGIVVRNLSLYPVRIAGLGFLLDGKKSFQLERDEHKEEWPTEIASHARMVVYASDGEWKQLEALGVRTRIWHRNFIAVAITETGSRFYSNRLSIRILRPFRTLLRWLRK